jgi:tetratricopeptide (TPR) repeat protein
LPLDDSEVFERMILRALVFLVAFTVASHVCWAQKNPSIDSLLNVLPKAHPGKERVAALNKLAFAYTLISVAEAEKFTKQSLQEARDANYETGLAEAFKIMGIIYYVRGEYNLSTQYAYEALTLYEKTNDKIGQAKVLNNLGLVSLAEKDYRKVYELSTKSLKLKREAGDSAGIATSYLALAECYLNQREYERAMTYCKEALERYRLKHDEWGAGHALLQIGEIFHEQKNYSFAFSYYNDALRAAQTSADYIQIITTYKKLGQLYLQTSRLDSAHSFLKKARNMARLKNNRNNEMQCDQLLADYFTTVGNLDSALQYTKIAMSIEREIFNHQKSEQIGMLQMLYNFQKKDQDLLFQKKIVRRQYVAIIGVTLILVLTVLLGIKFYNLNKFNRLAKEELQKLNDEVKEMNSNLESKVHERTEKIKIQNQKLVEFTFFTAHEVRGPVARILGLIELAKLKELSDEDRLQIFTRLEQASYELDEVIRIINRKLEKGEEM